MKPHPIIFIDDDVEDLSIMTEMAEAMYYPNTVVAFDKPEAALAYLKKLDEPPMFILSDVCMPKINGFDLRQELLKIQPTIRDVPYFLHSSSRTEEELSRSANLNVTAYYQKSTSFEGMRKTLESIQLQLKAI
jgi:response regulator RpfG family c-di-GMP phosphodiesterase